MYRNFKAFVLLVITLAMFGPVWGASDITANQGAHWKQLTSDKAFSYKDQLETVKEMKPAKPVDQGKLARGVEDVFNFFGGKTMQVIIWSLFGMVAIYVIYKLVLANDSSLFTRKKKSVGVAHDLDEELAEEADWEALLQKAIAANDVKQAVRYSYMWLLQLLQDAELIRYREDKTNFDYYRELQNTAFKQPFRQLSRQYEYVIYGNYMPTTGAYNQYIDLFNQVKRQLGR